MLSKRERDLVIYDRSLWQDNLWIGKRGEAVKALQKLLINENLWNSDVEATGYFGPITKAAVIKFQEKFASEILKPLELTKGTGFVGVYTRKFLNAYASGISPRPDVK